MTNKLKKNLYILSSLLIVILVFYLFKLLKMVHFLCLIIDIVLPVVFGYILAWILYPLFNKLNKKMNKRLSLSVLIILFVGVYGLILWKFLPLFIDNVSNILEMFNALINKVAEIPYFKDLSNLKTIDVNVLINSCTNVVESLGIFAFAHVFGFYILFTYENINAFFKRCVPSKFRKFYKEYTEEVSNNMRQYIKGTLIDTLILFVVSSIIYFFIGLKYPVLLALFSAITNIIPFIGPYIGGIPAAMLGFSRGINTGIITVSAIFIVQLIESNIINPMIMSKCIKINPILIIIMLTIMGKFFGLMGMIFAVPVLILIKISIPYAEKYRKKLKIVDS